MPRNGVDRQNGLPAEWPGRGLVSLDMTEGTEPGIVSVFASVSSRGFPAVVRLNLFSELSGIRQHVASCFLNSGDTGEFISVTGHLADSWHVTGQASAPQQDVRVSLVSTGCCATPAVVVQPSALVQAFTEGGGGLYRAPWVPMGVNLGAAGVFSVAGTSTVNFPPGSRLTHWIAEGSAAGAAIQIRRPPPASGVDLILPIGATRLEAFPAGLVPVTSIDFQLLTRGLFEFVA